MLEEFLGFGPKPAREQSTWTIPDGRYIAFYGFHVQVIVYEFGVIVFGGFPALLGGNDGVWIGCEYDSR